MLRWLVGLAWLGFLVACSRDGGQSGTDQFDVEEGSSVDDSQEVPEPDSDGDSETNEMDGGDSDGPGIGSASSQSSGAQDSSSPDEASSSDGGSAQSSNDAAEDVTDDGSPSGGAGAEGGTESDPALAGDASAGQDQDAEDTAGDEDDTGPGDDETVADNPVVDDDPRDDSPGYCEDPDHLDPLAPSLIEHREAHTTTGDGGEFTDFCNEEGDLVEYACEWVPSQMPNSEFTVCEEPVAVGDTADCFQTTGRVIEETVDCQGECRAGRCFEFCPTFDDEVSIQSFNDDVATIVNLTSGAIYQCELQAESNAPTCLDTINPAPVTGVGVCTLSEVRLMTPDRAASNRSCEYQCSVLDRGE